MPSAPAAEPLARFEADRVAAEVRARLFSRVTARAVVVDRYRILYRLGRGGMGIVYAAHDPQLHRKIAVKLVAPAESRWGSSWIASVTATSGAVGEARQRRLLKEARAMARVTHPNVVEVLGAGIHAGMAYIAMELLDGLDLRRWLEAATRTTDEILNVFEQAGRGLAAAHAAGLIHRDFKPENVVVTRNGRVKVLDFGLAVASSRSWAESDEEPRWSVTTKVGGTRAYMPPEQRRGVTMDPRSDQYAFCVALLEALGYRGSADNTGVPSRLLRVIDRGRSPRIEDRYPSMESMLAALATARRDTRWAWAVLSVGSLATVVGMFGLREKERAECHEIGRQVQKAWSAPQRGRIEALAEDSVDRGNVARVTQKLDTYAGQWTNALQTACQSRSASKSTREFARTWQCLDRARTSLSLLAHSIEGTHDIERAVEAVENLPSTEECLRAPPDAPTTPEDPADAAKLKAIREQAALVRTLDELGRFEDAYDIGSEALQRARLFGEPAALADVLGSLAHVEAELSRADDALEHTTEAYFLARRAGDDAAAAWLATELGKLAYNVSADPGASEQWFSSARSLLDRLGRPERRVARLERFMGDVASSRGLEKEALEHYGKVLEILESNDGEGAQVTLASLLVSMGRSNEVLGKLDLAEQQLQRAHRLYVGHRGQMHPHSAVALVNLGVLDANRGRYGPALVWFGAAIGMIRAARGENHHDLILPWTGLGHAVLGLGQPGAAKTLVNESLRITETTYGPSHPSTVQPLSALAEIEDRQGYLEGALSLYRRARDNVAIARGYDSALVARIENNMGWVLRRLGRFDEALPLYEHSVTVMTDAVGPHSPKLTAMLLGLGACRVELGAYEIAVEPLEQAIRLFDPIDLPTRFLGDAYHYLGRADLHVPGRRDQAVPRLLVALSIHGATGPQQLFDRTRRLLQTHML